MDFAKLQRRLVRSAGPARSQHRCRSRQVKVGDLLRPAVAACPACNQRRKLVSLGRWVAAVSRDGIPSSPWTLGILLLLQALQPGSKACYLLPELWCRGSQLLPGACQGIVAVSPQTIRLHTGACLLQPTHASQPSRVVGRLLQASLGVESKRAAACLTGALLWNGVVPALLFESIELASASASTSLKVAVLDLLARRRDAAP